MDIIFTFIVWAFAILALVFLGVLIGLIVYARWHYGTLEKCGFPVVKPHFFLGSNPNGHNENSQHIDLERSKTYGSVYGVYYGRAPNVFVSDPKLLRLILSRDFEHFKSHKHQTGFMHEVTCEILDFLHDEKWRTIRTVLSPLFTSAKLKKMSEKVSEVAEDYVNALVRETAGKDVFEMDFRPYIKPLLLEMMAKCWCGINIENGRDPDNKTMKTLKEAFGGDFILFDWKYTLLSSFPFLSKFYQNFSNEAVDEFANLVKDILKAREESGTEEEDMIQVMLEISRKAETDPEYKRLGITLNTAIGQAYGFLFSYEGLRATLGPLMYYLATLPDVQEKLLDEIDRSLVTSDGKVTWDVVGEMPYLAGCLFEVCRLAPGFARPDRICTKDWEHDGIKIKKDMEVVIPLWALHRDPEQYPDPEKFEPERWMPGRKEKLNPFSFGTFGNGPRACLGQRFKNVAMRIITVHYLKEFRVQRRPETVFRTKPGAPVFIVYDPIIVDFVKRK